MEVENKQWLVPFIAQKNIHVAHVYINSYLQSTVKSIVLTCLSEISFLMFCYRMEFTYLLIKPYTR